jgi:prepilin-type N-terminal cleavage/methylation domain-containing protein
VRKTGANPASLSRNKQQCRFTGPRAGLTLLELVFVIAILAILAALALPAYPQWVARAEQAKCMANMRNLHIGLNTYLNDHDNIWPQGPAPEEGAVWARFWIDRLETVGVPARTWECPTIYKMLGKRDRTQITDTSIHYVPTMFDDKQGTARLWPSQPWLVERADAHGHGALICFTDGSIKPFNKVMAELGFR